MMNTQVFPNTRHLRAFVKVAELGNISHAAEAVHLSQPAVTHAIANLESALETVLFTRLHKGMGLTETGAVYLNRVNRALAEIARGAREVAQKNANSAQHFDHRVTAPQLRALVALTEARSFSLAARNIGISQPSIHRAGRELERIVGQPLFVATGRGIDLTPVAETLVKRVRLAAAELRQGFYEIAALQGQDSAKITVGSLPLVRTWILPQAIDQFLTEKQHVQIATVEGSYPKMLRDIRQGHMDFLIGALRDPHPGDDIVQEVLFKDSLSVVVRFGHPLTRLKNVALDNTLAYPWIAPPKATPTGLYLSAALGIPSLPQTPVKLVTSSLILMRGLLMAGDYVTLASASQLRYELENQTLVALPIVLKDSARPIGLTYRKDWDPTPTQNRLLQIIRRVQQSATGPVPA